MAPGLKPKRAPQTWAATQKNSRTDHLDDANPATPRSEAVAEAENAVGKVALSKATAKATTKAQKKLPPAADAVTEVYSEFLAAKQKRCGLPSSSVQDSRAMPVQPTQPNYAGTAPKVNAQGSARASIRSREPRLPSQSPDRSPPSWAGDNVHPPNSSGTRLNTSPQAVRNHEGRDKGSVSPAEEFHIDSSDENLERRSRKVKKQRNLHRRPRSPSSASSDDEARRYRYSRKQDRSYSPSSSSSERRVSDRRRSGRSENSRHDRRHSTPRSSRDDYLHASHRAGGKHRRHSTDRRHSHRRERSPSPRGSSSPGSPTGRRARSQPRRERARSPPKQDQNKDIGSSSAQRDVSTVSTRHRRLLSTFSIKPKSALGQERREREAKREEAAEARENRGKKPHYINVSSEGKPYGLGVTMWNDNLAKLVRGLDPSYVDVRQQPFHLMDILMRRLSEDFDYSEPLNPAWLRGRVGNALSSYRHELIRMIQLEQERPPWVSETICTKLVKLEGSEKFRQKSEQMKFANSCRRTKGRTGPLGEVGITERLRAQLGKSPEPEEVVEEMHRDKGYSGRNKRRSVSQSTVHTLVEENVSRGGEGPLLPAIGTGSPQAPLDNANISSESPQEEAVANAVSVVPDGCSDPAEVADVESMSATPLETMIRKQIEELRTSAMGNSDDVRSLIGTMMLQLEWMKRREDQNADRGQVADGTRASDPLPPQMPVAANIQSSPVQCLPVVTPPENSQNPQQKTKTNATLKPTRKSGRPSKPKVRLD